MKIIAHESINHGIGRNNSLMFKLPQDMKFFRETTTGGVVIMGRKTLESFPGKKPLPNRVNIVLSHNPGFNSEGIVLAGSVSEALEESKKYPGKEVFVIGGANIYELMLPYCDTALITRVFEDADADAFIHDFDSDPEWTLTRQSDEINDNGHIIRFLEYKRI